MIARCPDCEVIIRLPEDAEIGDMLDCPSCGIELEVVGLDPPELDYALDYDLEEEWEEVWDEEEEEELWDEDEEPLWDDETF